MMRSARQSDSCQALGFPRPESAKKYDKMSRKITFATEIKVI